MITINLSKSPTFLGNFCEGVKIYHFSREIIFYSNFYRHLAIFFWSHCTGPFIKPFESLFHFRFVRKLSRTLHLQGRQQSALDREIWTACEKKLHSFQPKIDRFEGLFITIWQEFNTSLAQLECCLTNIAKIIPRCTCSLPT